MHVRNEAVKGLTASARDGVTYMFASASARHGVDPKQQYILRLRNLHG